MAQPSCGQRLHCKSASCLQGKAPEGYEFIDEEEEYVIAANGRSGSWQPYQPGQAEQAAVAPPQKKPTKRKSKKKAEAQEAGKQDDSIKGMEEI